jgi:HTH-type transcriptional regulator/antitoxin HigA
MKRKIELKPIRSEAEYENALRAVSPYFDNEPELGTPDADQFEMLLLLIEAYEAKHHPILPPDPIEAIKFRMEQAGLTPKDLEPMIGRSNRVYEILAGRRPLTLAMIRKLHKGLGIPAESLIGLNQALSLIHI